MRQYVRAWMMSNGTSPGSGPAFHRNAEVVPVASIYTEQPELDADHVDKRHVTDCRARTLAR